MKNVLKKGLSVFLAFAILFSSAYVGLNEIDFNGLFAVEAEAASESDLTFTLNKDGESYSVTGCNRRVEGEVVIPSIYNGLPVTSISRTSFSSCENLTSITIPASIENVEYDAFFYCESLAAIKVDVNNPAYLSDEGVLFNKDKTTLIQYPAGKTATEFIIPDGVTSIGESAFRGCSTLTSITIPDSVASIGMYAFVDCTNLTSLVIPDGVTRLDLSVFYNCKNLVSITIPDSVTYIVDYAFSGCTSLTSIKIPDSVRSISCGAFSGCTSLTSFAIGDGVTYIFSEAFSGCTSLESITIPAGVTSISDKAFAGCDALDTVYYTGLLSDWSQINIGSGNESLTNANIVHSCTYGEWVVTGEPTCITEGYKHKECLYCGDTVTETLPATGEHYSSNWIDNFPCCGAFEGYRYGNCDYCGEYMEEPVPAFGDHIFGEWFVETQATCLTEGKKYRMCICGFTEEEVIPALGHDYSDEWTIDIAPTCTEKGSKSHHCANCGDKKDVTEILANGHYYTDGVCSVCSVDAIFEYTISDGCVTITKYIGTATEVTVPEKINGYLVTSIGSSTFKGCTSLTAIEIPDSVTSIGYSAFSGCSSLASIDIPNSVTTIGSIAFLGCTSLTSITIPDSVTSIGGYAFQNCVNLTTATISAGLKNIPESLFAYCENLKSVNIPDAVESIGGDAFSGCTSLTSIEIPAGVTSIGYSAFSGCSSLSSIEIPDSVTSIGSSAFYGCTNLTSIEIPAGVTSIGSSTFNGCTNLTSIEIPDGVTSIGSSAFYGCSSLTSIEIPDGVTSIGSSAFYGCSSLTSIEIPDGVTSIEAYVFKDCSSLSSIEIPDSVKTIGEKAFWQCRSLSFITIGSGVESIGNSAFYCCGALEVVNIKDVAAWCAIEYQVDSISNPSYTYPLTYGTNLYINGEIVTDIVIPDGVTTIPRYAFSCKNIKSITIPASVTSIEDGAFYNAQALESVYITDIAAWCNIDMGLNPLEAARYIYLNDELITDLVIPDGVATIPNYAFSYENIVSATIPDSVEKICDSAFYNCTNLDSVNFGNGVTSIGLCAFCGCTSLTSIEIPDSVTNIGSSSFQGCTSLVSVSIGDGVKNIDDSAFRKCTGLTSIIIPDGVTTVGYSAFGECNNLVSITIPSSLTSIGSYAFSGCQNLSRVNITDIGAWCAIEFGDATANPIFNAQHLYINGVLITDIVIPYGTTIINDLAFCNYRNLTSVTIPETVTAIGERAFYYCYGLTSVTIPDSITTIGKEAFYNCTGLKTVELGSGVTSIGEEAFNYCSALEAVNVAEENSYFSSVDGVLFDKNKTNLLLYPDRRVETAFTVPDTVVSFSDWVFSDSNIETIVLGTGCSSLSNSLFNNCQKLKNVVIPSEVTIIVNSAFSSCRNITDVYYEGTQDEWSAVCSGTDIPCLSDGRLHYSVDIENWDKHYGEPEVIKEVTCTSNGSQKYTCPCGHTYTETIYSTGHSYPDEWTIGSAPTCTEDGYRYKKCANCDSEKRETITATGHTETLWITELDPTCVASGYKDEYCLICGDLINSEVIPATGHDDSDEWIIDVEPTCTEEGSKYRYCTVCGEKGDTAVIEALGHDYEVVSVAEEHPHITTFKCSRCPETKEEESYSQKCVLCNFTFTDVDAETCKITSYIGSAATFVIPATINGKKVTTTNTGAFKNNTFITSVKIENGVQGIGSLSFLNCTALSKIVIPESVTSIGASTFRSCASDFTIYCYRDSYAMQYAIDNSLNYVIMDIGETADTTIDYENKLIYTTVDGSASLGDIVYIPKTSDTSVTASLVSGENEYLGTGSIVTVVDDGVSSEYTLVVDSDTNGDSVCDVLDCADVERCSTGKAELSGAYAMAADSNADDVVDINDYQSIINKALA